MCPCPIQWQRHAAVPAFVHNIFVLKQLHTLFPLYDYIIFSQKSDCIIMYPGDALSASLKMNRLCAPSVLPFNSFSGFLCAVLCRAKTAQQVQILHRRRALLCRHCSAAFPLQNSPFFTYFWSQWLAWEKFVELVQMPIATPNVINIAQLLSTFSSVSCFHEGKLLCIYNLIGRNWIFWKGRGKEVFHSMFCSCEILTC